jgi:exosortase/archaeosortase family protein
MSSIAKPRRLRRQDAREAVRNPAPSRSASLSIMLRFLVGWAVALVLLSAFPGVKDLAIRGTVGTLSLVLGLPPPLPDAVLPVGSAYWMIVTDCTPLMPTITLTLAMIAFPAALRWKILGVLAGGAAIWAFNTLRLVVLYFTEALLPRLAPIVHVYFFQTLAFLFVCILFMLWIRLQARREAA